MMPRLLLSRMFKLPVLSLFSAAPTPTTVLSFTTTALPLQHPAEIHRLCRSNEISRDHIHKIVLHATPITTSSWKPCAQPRFDEFASYTVGPWVQPSSSNDNTASTQEVEEVMRSCGGAIQGIRELPLSMIYSTDEDIIEERTYHNRADGGFVYADDGSYSSGPERWDLSASDESGGKLMMASLAFPDKRRMWLSVKLSEASGVVAECTTSEHDAGVQKIANTKILELSRPVSTLDFADGDDLASSMSDLPNVNWEVVQRVRMPNSNQAWSLARAKWEKLVSEACGATNEDDDAARINKGLMGWSYIDSVSGDQVGDLFRDVATETINLHMLAVCPVSGVARSVVRCYDTDGCLKSVAFLSGSLATPDEES